MFDLKKFLELKKKAKEQSETVVFFIKYIKRVHSITNIPYEDLMNEYVETAEKDYPGTIKIAEEEVKAVEIAELRKSIF